MLQLTGDLAACRNHSQLIEYPLNFTRLEHDNDGEDDKPSSSAPLAFRIKQKFSCEMLGGCTWRGSALLARMLLFAPALEYLCLRHRTQPDKQPPSAATIGSATISNASGTTRLLSCIELGAGTGLVSLAAAAAPNVFSRVVATEIDEDGILQLLEANITSTANTSVIRAVSEMLCCHSPPKTCVCELAWGEMDLPPATFELVAGTNIFDLVLGSEVIYEPELNDKLLATLLALTAIPNPLTGLYSTVVLSNDTRGGDAAQHFFSRAAKYFSVDRVSADLVKEFAPDWVPFKTAEEGVFVMHRRHGVADHRTGMSRFRKIRV